MRSTHKTKLSNIKFFIHSKRQKLGSFYGINAFYLYTPQCSHANVITESRDNAKPYKEEHTRQKFGNPYKKIHA